MVFLFGRSTSWISFLWYRIPSLMNNLFHCLMNCFISGLSVSLPFQHCSSFALNKWMILPIVLSLNWASAESYVVINLEFNEGSWSSSRWLESSGLDTVFDTHDSSSRHVGWLCLDDWVIALLTMGVSGIEDYMEWPPYDWPPAQ